MHNAFSVGIRGILWSRMKFQILYECPDLDFQASYEKLAQSNLVSVDTTEKGLLYTYFKNFKVLFLISPKGKIQVKWEDPKQKEILVELLRSLLVSSTGKDVVLHPLEQNITVEYPAPKEIELWWCGEKDSYVHKDEAKHQNIMDLPEFSEVDWRKISRRDKNNLYKVWIQGNIAEELGIPEQDNIYRDAISYLLKTHALEKDSKPLKEKLNSALNRVRKRTSESEKK